MAIELATDPTPLGTEEGDTCGRDGCTASLAFRQVDTCTCHICAPCNACTASFLACPGCGWEQE